MVNDSKYLEFKRSFSELSSKYKNAFPLRRENNKMTKKRAQVTLALSLYKEILIILQRIDNEIVILEELQTRVKNNLQEGKFDSNSEFGKMISDQLEQRELLKIDMKSLFQWAFTLEDLLGKGILPRSIKAFRNIFIVHLPEKIALSSKFRLLQTSVLYNNAGVKLLFLPIFGMNKFRGLKKIVDQIKTFIPDVTKESNSYERVRLIWENLDKLPDSLIKGSHKNPKHFLNLLGEYGSMSPELSLVTKSLLLAWDKKVKKMLS